MRNSKQLFVLDMSVKEILIRISKYPVHFFAADLNLNVLMANDMQAEYFGANSVNEFIGQNYYDIIPKEEQAASKANDALIIKSNTPQLFYEICLGNEVVGIGFRLYDSCNHVIGIAGIGFYLHQVAPRDIITITNKLISLRSVTNAIKCNHIHNTCQLNELSNREQECVHYLTKNMTCKETAKLMNISYRTVEKHLENIKNKLGCYSRSDIISRFFEQN